ncbi:hypothetical protein MNV49_006499 [Pseudohyphozyma bogoriensis]|nr:hypothetical protein MNV49_006499 [Pseudohyphozyma bogoriensis]
MSIENDTKPHDFASPKLDDYKQQVMTDFHKQYNSLQDQRAKLTEKYVKPAQDYAVKQVGERPVATVLSGIFMALSFLPALTFAGFCLSTAFVVFGGSLLFGLFWTFAIILGASLLLLGTLVVTFSTAVFLTFWVLTAYVCVRLVTCLVKEGSLAQGAKAFDAEMRAIFVAGRPNAATSTTNSATQ